MIFQGAVYVNLVKKINPNYKIKNGDCITVKSFNGNYNNLNFVPLRKKRFSVTKFDRGFHSRIKKKYVHYKKGDFLVSQNKRGAYFAKISKLST